MKIDDMVAGYRAGCSSGAMELPDCYAKETVAFRHGWLNGRDDRVCRPRERYGVLKARADMILGEEANEHS